MPKNYFKIVSIDLWLCLKNLSLKLNDLSKIPPIRFISNIFGKISFLGYSGNYFYNFYRIFLHQFNNYFLNQEIVFNNLIKYLISNCYQNENWKKISYNLFDSILAKYLEHSLINLISNSSW